MSKKIKVQHKTNKGNTPMNDQVNQSNEEVGNQEELLDTTTEAQEQESGKGSIDGAETTAEEDPITQETITTTEVSQPGVANVDQTAATASPEAVSTKAEIIDTHNEVLTEFQQYTKDILTNGTEVEKNLVIGLEEYITRVAPNKPVEPTEGVNAQRSLLELIRAVTHTSDKQQFNKLWKILIAYFAEYSGNYKVFHESYINRFTEYWQGGPAQLEAFRNITHLLRTTAEHKSTNYKNLESVVAIDRVLNKYFTEEARNNVIGFYRK